MDDSLSLDFMDPIEIKRGFSGRAKIPSSLVHLPFPNRILPGSAILPKVAVIIEVHEKLHH